MKSEDERRELLERAQQINELTATPGWKMLVDFVNETRFPMHKRIIAGLPSHEEYIEQVAWLKGADYVIRANEYLNAQIKADTQARGELAEA